MRVGRWGTGVVRGRLVEEYLGKDKKLNAAFIYLERVYDKADSEALWSVLRIYGVGGWMLRGC